MFSSAWPTYLLRTSGPLTTWCAAAAAAAAAAAVAQIQYRGRGLLLVCLYVLHDAGFAQASLAMYWGVQVWPTGSNVGASTADLVWQLHAMPH
jgi:hypothetical protein